MRAMRITFPPLFYDVLCKASGSVSRQTDSQHLQKALLLGIIDSPLGGATPPFVGHTNATGIDEAYPAMVAIELHMCEPANHDLLRDISEDHVQTLIRSGSGQGFFIAAGRAVTEEDSAQALDRQDELFLK